jgi:hypothetical protein
VRERIIREEVIMGALNGLLNVVLGLLTAVLGTVLGIVAALLMVVGAVLCVTLILIPLGIPVIKLSRRLFGLAGKMMHVP